MSMYKVSPNVSPKNQTSTSCCWLTCLEMLFEWKNKDSSKILEKMDASPNLFPYYMKDNGIAPGECKETAKMLGLKWAGDGDFTGEILHGILKSYGPVWVAGQWIPGYSHVIVVTGVDKDDGRIKIVNPWKNYDLSESPRTVSWLNERGTVWKTCPASIMYW
ncbi:MAG TPA: papain-like cysteine protease family protein [Pyrinomonadaceae bacterium]|nr:papain-like cysteine protease family protein [Pyrinomonadaceae bacterium]